MSRKSSLWILALLIVTSVAFRASAGCLTRYQGVWDEADCNAHCEDIVGCNFIGISYACSSNCPGGESGQVLVPDRQCFGCSCVNDGGSFYVNYTCDDTGTEV